MRFTDSAKPHILRRILLPVAVFLVVIAFFYYAIDSVSRGTVDHQKEVLENAVFQDVVYCYSIEGAYPDTVEYLEKNYGLTYDHERFFVGYRLQGSNIMPDITIIDLKASGYSDIGGGDE